MKYSFGIVITVSVLVSYFFKRHPALCSPLPECINLVVSYACFQRPKKSFNKQFSLFFETAAACNIFTSLRKMYDFKTARYLQRWMFFHSPCMTYTDEELFYLMLLYYQNAS